MGRQLYSVDSLGVPYAEAMKFIERLLELGIQANITSGGVAIYPEGVAQEGTMKQVAKDFGVPEPYRGRNEHQERFYAKHPDLPGANINKRPGSKE